jgi:hypothetical protein
MMAFAFRKGANSIDELQRRFEVWEQIRFRQMVFFHNLPKR